MRQDDVERETIDDEGGPETPGPPGRTSEERPSPGPERQAIGPPERRGPDIEHLPADEEEAEVERQ